MAEFIKLTDTSGRPILVNVEKIDNIYRGDKRYTEVTTSQATCSVAESVDQIEKLITA